MCGAKRRMGWAGGEQHRQTGKVARESRVTPLNNHRVIADEERDRQRPGDAPDPPIGQTTDEGKDGGELAFRERQMECSPGGGDCIGGDCIVYPRPSGN